MNNYTIIIRSLPFEKNKFIPGSQQISMTLEFKNWQTQISTKVFDKLLDLSNSSMNDPNEFDQIFQEHSVESLLTLPSRKCKMQSTKRTSNFFFLILEILYKMKLNRL